MTVCAVCGKVIKTCCEIYEEAEDKETGETVLICGQCVQDIEDAEGVCNGNTD